MKLQDGNGSRSIHTLIKIDAVVDRKVEEFFNSVFYVDVVIDSEDPSERFRKASNRMHVYQRGIKVSWHLFELSLNCTKSLAQNGLKNLTKVVSELLMVRRTGFIKKRDHLLHVSGGVYYLVR